MTLHELRRTEWKECDQETWHRVWQAQLENLPDDDRSEFMMITGTLLPIWRSIGGEDMKIYRLKTDDGQVLLGCKLESREMAKFRKSMALDAVQLAAEDILAGIEASESYSLVEGLRIKRRRGMGENRIEVATRGGSTILDNLVRLGCISKIIAYQRRMLVPVGSKGVDVLGRIMAEYPVAE